MHVLKPTLLSILLGFTPLLGQSPPSLPTFEVASVKAAGPEESPLGRGVFTFPGGSIRINKVTFLKLVEEAFDLQPFQISGGPRWTSQDRYNIEAKPPLSSESSHANPAFPKMPLNGEQRLMLRSLLISRFGLVFHTEDREGPVYVLARGSKEPKLDDAKDKTAYPWAGGLSGGAVLGDGLAGKNESMEDLAKRLAPYLGRPVLDRTELKGSYDFRVPYASDDPHPDVVSVILECVRELGLKLEASRGPIKTLVIDGAEKPTEN